jgi:hypothetical protein
MQRKVSGNLIDSVNDLETAFSIDKQDLQAYRSSYPLFGHW